MIRKKLSTFASPKAMAQRFELPPPYVVGFLVAILMGMEIVNRAYIQVPYDNMKFGAFYLGDYLVIGLWVSIFVLPLWLLLFAIRNQYKRFLAFLAMVVVFSFSWQATALMGVGIRRHPHFLLIQTVFILAFALGLLGLVAFLLSPLPKRIKWLLAMLLTSLMLAFNIYSLPDYSQFHGHLSLACALMILYLILSFLKPIATKTISGLVLTLFIFCVFHSWPSKHRVLAEIRSFTSLTHNLLQAAPQIGVLSFYYTSLISPLREIPERAQKALAQKYALRQEAYAHPHPRDTARNVLIIVLESTRADYWSNPTIASKFAQWSKNGTYFPKAVASFSNTPLSYGAMFTSQSPLVLIQSPFWAHSKIVWDDLVPRFSVNYLSKPDHSIFTKVGTITDFVMPMEATFHVHKEAESGLAHIRQALEGLEEDETFFSWIHLIEPHSPYDAHPGFSFEGDNDQQANYKSEIAYMDHHLGELMEWLYASRFAEDTFVVLYADHGEGLGEIVDGRSFWHHGRVIRNFVIQIPAYFSGPGIPANTREEKRQISHLDILPSIYYALNLTPNPAYFFQGQPIQILLDKPRPVLGQDLRFGESSMEIFNVIDAIGSMDVDTSLREFRKLYFRPSGVNHKLALFQDSYKLTYNKVLDRYRLYGLDDFEEETDLSAIKPEQLAKLKQSLEDWIEEQCWVLQRINDGHRARMAKSPQPEP